MGSDARHQARPTSLPIVMKGRGSRSRRGSTRRKSDTTTQYLGQSEWVDMKGDADCEPLRESTRSKSKPPSSQFKGPAEVPLKEKRYG